MTKFNTSRYDRGGAGGAGGKSANPRKKMMMKNSIRYQAMMTQNVAVSNKEAELVQMYER